MNFIEFITGLAWREPLWFLLLLFPLILIFVLKFNRTRAFNKFADQTLHSWVLQKNEQVFYLRLFSVNSAYLLAWCLITLSLSGPRIPLEVVGEEYKNGVDIMLVVDVSRSMGVEDVKPNRLRRAQLEIDELLNLAKANRFGMIVFAARAHVYVPLTSDIDSFRHYLADLDRLVLPTQASAPGKALQLAYEQLSETSSKAAIVFLSDGDFSFHNSSTQATQFDNVLNKLRNANIPLYSLGIGTQEGDAIPLDDGDWLKHQGRHVISRLNESLLQKMASATAGEYSLLYDDSRDWQQLYSDGIAKLAAELDIDKNDNKIVWQELYGWTLFPALVLLLLAYAPGLLKNFKSITSLVGVFFVLHLFLNQEVFAAGVEKQAYQAYQLQEYHEAVAKYRELAGFTARFGEGASHYRAGDFKGAIRQFNKAVLLAENDQARASALFNLGNSYFKAGDYSSAIQAFQDSLLYRNSVEATEHNLLLSQTLQAAVEKRIEELIASGRMGSGPRRVRLREGTDVNERGAVFIDESEEVRGQETGLPELPDHSIANMQALVQRGLNFIQLADQTDMAAVIDDLNEHKLSVITAQQYMQDIDDDSGALWQRIFEIEEGFPAPLEQPRHVPGELPW